MPVNALHGRRRVGDEVEVMHMADRLRQPGIVTNGGVASTIRDAHVREFSCTVLEDGCAAFSDEVHRAAIEGLRPIARIMTVAQAIDEVRSTT